MKLGDGLQSKRGKNNHTCPMFDNDFLASSNQMKLCTTDYIFPIKQDDICDYNPLCFMSSGLMLDNIIMNIFTESTKKSNTSHQEHFFRFQNDTIHLYKRSMQDFTWKRENADTKITLRSHHYIEIEKLVKYISGVLYIESDKADLGKKMDQFINDKSEFDNTHIIKSNIQHVSNIPEEERFVSSMTPIGFRNGQYESRFYVNSLFQVLFFNIFLEH